MIHVMLTYLKHLGFPDLHQEVVRKSRFLLVQQGMDLAHSSRHVAYRFIDTITPFLKRNLYEPQDSSIKAWNSHLRAIFEKGLKLSLYGLLLDTEVRYRWPGFNESFDRNTMKIVGITRTGDNARVRISCFPAIVTAKSTGSHTDVGSRNKPIHKARVLLR